MTIRVLVADDQAMVRAGFRMLLAREPDIEVVAEATSGSEVVRLAARYDPTVVLMDIRMPELDGIEATRRIIAANSLARVLILTTFDLDEYVYEALRAGASGFLLKNVAPDGLVDSVRTVAAGEALLAPALTRRMIEHFVQRPPTDAVRPTAPADLTEREVEVLTSLARGNSNREIAAELFLSEATVKTYVARILGKLGLRDRVQAVVWAYENGLAQIQAR
ncbi:MAG: hypothetical protein QOK15_1495 [Nocardioidaceae bacterium]|nr:hypothetical protein [Nocardioidaceae bacterium]